MTPTRALGTALVAIVFIVLLAQVVPYGRAHVNPPDGAQTAFDSQATQDLATRACFDCHSNRTRWPWYSSIAPISWRIQHDVNEGREKLNFTAFDATGKMADAAGESGEEVTKGEMPPKDYLLMHPEARLTPAERALLARGLGATFAAFAREGPGGGEAGEAERGEHGD